MTQLEFKLAYYNEAVQYVSHYTMETPSSNEHGQYLGEWPFNNNEYYKKSKTCVLDLTLLSKQQ